MADRGPATRVTLHRFFVPPESIIGDTIAFTREQSRQISAVLRLRSGDRIVVLDGTGMEYDVRLKGDMGAIEASRRNAAEPRVAISLYQGMLKGAKLELVLQKCTEIGVSRFVPIETARSVAREPGAGKVRRYETIVREAAEQSGRGRLPIIEQPLAFSDALRDAAARGPIILPWEGERATALDALALDSPPEMSIVVGPEGGFTDDEVAEARAAGAAVVTLGPRILRAETAAIVTSALLLFLLVDGSSSRYL